MNTQEIRDLISNLSFEPTLITKINNVVIVNLDYFTNRNYQSQGINEFLYTLSGYKNHIIAFLIRDGVNCRITGIREAIKKVIRDLELTAETCYVYGYDNLELENTTYIDMDVLQMWGSLCYARIKDLPLSTNKFQKKFAALYGRHDLYRLKLFRHLYTYHKDESFLAFNSINGLYSSRFKNEFDEDSNWYHSNCPVFLDFKNANNWVPYGDSLDNIGIHYNNYFIEIVAETDIYTDKFYTEKTIKNFYLGKPFLLWSGANSLSRLQNEGFQTFSPYIDESYDRISNVRDRFEAIVMEIDRLAKLPNHELARIHDALSERFEYNRDFFVKTILTR
jgi:hypothetical protein